VSRESGKGVFIDKHHTNATYVSINLKNMIMGLAIAKLGSRRPRGRPRGP